MRFLIILLLLMGCASSPPKLSKYSFIEPSAVKYVKEFDKLLWKYQKRRVPTIVIKFHKYPHKNPTATTCFTLEPTYCPERGIITLNKDRWPTMTNWERREVIYHELGHHVLKRTHLFQTKKEIFARKCGKSLMNRLALEKGCFKKHFKYYMNELFTVKSKWYPKDH